MSSCVADEGNDSGAAVRSAMQFEERAAAPLLKSMPGRPKPILGRAGSRLAAEGSRHFPRVFQNSEQVFGTR